MVYEIKVILHTVNGDVTTAYPIADKELAIIDIAEYVQDNKSFTIVYE